MTLHRPMFPPREAVHARQGFAASVVLDRTAATAPPPKPATIGRRGLLGAFLALVPAAVTAGAVASLPASAPPAPRESRRLLWLGQQLDQAEASLAEALTRKVRCRELAEEAYPEPAMEITFVPGEHPPAWCGVREETDVDGKIVWWKQDPRFRSTARKIAASDLLEEYLTHADGRTKAAREAARMLPFARDYEAAIEKALEESGYRAADDEVYQLARRIDRIASMIYKCECRTFEGVAIKALALLVAVKADVVDDYIAHRSKVLYATRLAGDVVRLGRVA